MNSNPILRSNFCNLRLTLTRFLYTPRSLAPSRYTLVMVRHGESEWTKKNLFCGWYDCPLSRKGKEQAGAAGLALRKSYFKFDLAFTSLLTRAHQTLEIITQILRIKIPVETTWRLNETHYGALTGLAESEMKKLFGDKQITLWKESYDVLPPPMTDRHLYYRKIMERYRGVLLPDEIPKYESLQSTVQRTLPYWNEVIAPEIRNGRNILIVAHENSLKGIIKHLDDVSDGEIMTLRLPTGIPFVYSLNEILKPVPNGSMQFLSDPEAAEQVASRQKAKPVDREAK